MKVVNLDIKIGKKGQNQLLDRKSVIINPTETTTVANIKASVQELLKYPFEKDSEQFFYGSKELKDTDKVLSMSGNEYIVIYK